MAGILQCLTMHTTKDEKRRGQIEVSLDFLTKYWPSVSVEKPWIEVALGFIVFTSSFCTLRVNLNIVDRLNSKDDLESSRRA